jgi:hypothetical protein
MAGGSALPTELDERLRDIKARSLSLEGEG